MINLTVKSKNILILTYWSYKDALVQTYTLPYVRMMREHLPAGSRIFLLTLEQPHLSMSESEAAGVREQLRGEGIHLLAFNYSRFGLKAAAKWGKFIAQLAVLCRREKISRIHAWCTPAGGAGYLLSRLTGIPLILDSYEPHAEAMVEIGYWRTSSPGYKILFLFEKLQSRRAAAVIATTRGMADYAREKYGARFKRFYVKPAGVNLSMFSSASVKDPELLRRYGLVDKLVCVYAGKIGGIYLGKEIFDFFKAASVHWGDRFRVLMLTNASAAQVTELALASGLDPRIIVSKFVPHAEMPQHMGLGDFAINPVRPVPTKRFCTSIKDGEYWAMGLPVVIPPNISDDSEIISAHKIGSIIRDFTAEAYLASAREIDEILAAHSRTELYEKIRAVAVEYRNFANADKIYEELYAAPDLEPVSEFAAADLPQAGGEVKGRR